MSKDNLKKFALATPNLLLAPAKFARKHPYETAGVLAAVGTAGLATAPAAGAAAAASGGTAAATTGAATTTAAQASLSDSILGYTSAAGTIAGGAAALRKPALPNAPRIPAAPSFAADSAAAAKRREKQALAAYGPLSTIKTGPLGLGGASKIGA